MIGLFYLRVLNLFFSTSYFKIVLPLILISGSIILLFSHWFFKFIGKFMTLFSSESDLAGNKISPLVSEEPLEEVTTLEEVIFSDSTVTSSSTMLKSPLLVLGQALYAKVGGN